MKDIIAALFLAIVVGTLFQILPGCNSAASSNTYDSLSLKKDLSSPELTPEQSIAKMHVEGGFEVKLVAAEPLVVAPVAMTFDDKGRIWEVEMQDYMPDTVGTGEDQPIGKVVILEDKNGDGVMDERKVFLDSLVLPRGICLLEDGILVAEPPMLWYYTIANDKPTKKILVDSTYAAGGNVEHQPNGLLRALDNWVYSAKCDKRYRKKGNEWLIERTHFRGQWGLSQDEDGRLFYNTNSDNLLGDYFTPGLGAANEQQRNVKGFVERIVANNTVYPARPTPGVNRGYMAGVLDDSLRLKSFTAACGPAIYTGNLFGAAYSGNAFVAEPSANLIKRNVIKQNENKIDGKQAYDNKEFLASEDERFRPVNLYTGPDGALYIVDMYRGIIQHKTYLTPYLKNEIKQRKLSKPLSAGRIYKIVPTNSKGKMVAFSHNPDTLLQLLQHPNGWVRNKAQQIIIDDNLTSLASALRNNLSAANNDLLIIHSLWTLEGLGALRQDDIFPLLTNTNFKIRRQALSALPSVLNNKNERLVADLLSSMMDSDSLAAPYIAYLVNDIAEYDKAAAKSMLTRLTKNYNNNVYVADAVISNLKNNEAAYYKQTLALYPDTTLAINKRLKKVLGDMDKEKNNRNSKELAKLYPKGANIFNAVCQTCHGADGNGVVSLAPPLHQSNWVVGDKNKLIPIVLFGLTGPIKIGDKMYKSPEINGDMPAIGQNKEFNDDDIAQLLSYIRNAWSNKADKISGDDITKARAYYKDRQNTFTMEELNKIR